MSLPDDFVPGQVIAAADMNAIKDEVALKLDTTTATATFRSTVNLGGYATASAVEDRAAALAAAIADLSAGGGEVFVPAGDWRIATAVSVPSNVAIRGEGPTTRLIHDVSTGPMLQALGAGGSPKTLSVATTVGASVLTLNNTTGMSEGSVVGLADTTQPIYGESTRTQAAVAGELIRVKSVDSATQITVRGRLEYAYTTATTVSVITPAENVSLSDLTIVKTNVATFDGGAHAFNTTFARNITVRNVRFVNLDAPGIYMQFTLGFLIDGCVFEDARDLEAPSNTPYNIIARNGTSHGIVSNCRGMYGRHLFTTGNSTTGAAASHILVTNCTAVEYTQAAFDTHPGSRWITFADCEAYHCANQGFQIRGPDSSVINPIVSQATNGVAFVNGADRGMVYGGRLSGCDTGVLVSSSDDVQVDSVRIQDPVTNGLLVQETASYAGLQTKGRFRDLLVTGNPATAAFNFNLWKDGFGVWGCEAPDATTKMTGNSAHTIASAATITPGRQSDSFLVTGTTGITSIAADVSQIGRVITLRFNGTLTVTDGGNLKLAGHLNAVSNTTLTLVCQGTQWWEISRSIN